MLENTCCCCSNCRIAARERYASWPSRSSGVIHTSLSARWTSSARNITAFTKLKIAVFAPMASVSERTATALTIGLWRNARNASRMSCEIPPRMPKSRFTTTPEATIA